MKILIAEDDVITSRTLEALLVKWGYTVVVVRDGDEAWKILQGDAALRLVILDWMMPGLDGIQICRQVRQRAEAPYVYLLLLTAKGNQEDVINGLEAGADDYLTKPFHALELKARLRSGQRILDLQQQLIADVTERKHAQAVLGATNARLTAVLDAATGVAIIATDTNGVITLFNQGAERMLGYTSDEMVGKQTPNAIYLPSEVTAYRQELSQRLGRPIAGFNVFVAKARQGGHDEREWTYVRKDGTHLTVNVLVTAVTDPGGAVSGFLGVATDITKRRELEQMKGEFVSLVSHELRTPLTSIRGALGLLAGGLLRSQPEKGERMLEIAVANTDRLVRLINDILDTERMESGKVNMVKQTCNAADLMTQAVDGVGSMAEKAGVTLAVSLHPARVWVDPDRIIQALTNLLSNAIKFSPRGGSVWLTATPQADQILFQVKDQGRGIPQEKREMIFERFQQVDASDRREKGGTGLGLAITRSIVQQHGGRVWVESTFGEGSTFFFTLPSLQAETVLVGDGPVARKVLVGAVEADICNAVRAILNQRGYTVMAAASWQEAIEMATSERPDAILLDSSLPGMESGEIITELKQKSHTQDVPVFGLGGAAPDGVQLAVMGMAGWVTKPLNQGSLLHAMESVLDKPTEGPRVLVVEDDADLARVLTTILERHGAVVFQARTGPAAIQVCAQFAPDLLVLDVILPELDGFGVVGQLRQDARWQHLPLLVYSVKELDDSEKARLRLGESIFLTKSRATPQEFEQRAMDLLNWATSGQRERRRR